MEDIDVLDGSIANTGGGKSKKDKEIAGNAKHVYSVKDFLDKLEDKTDKKNGKGDKDKDKGGKGDKGGSSSGKHTTTGKLEEDKSHHTDPDYALKHPDKWTKEHTTYENGYYWVKNKDGTKTKLTRWSLDNANGVNLDYASNGTYRDAVTSLFGTYDKQYNPSGVKDNSAKLRGEVVKLGNTKVVRVTVGKYTTYILDTNSTYSEKDLNAAADLSSSKVKAIFLKDKDIKANINTNMNLDKLTKKQITELLKGNIKPTLSIKDDGKTLVVTDKAGKKYTIKFKDDISKVGSIYGIGDLRDLYTKGFSMKQIQRLMKAGDASFSDPNKDTNYKQFKADLESQGEKNAQIKGNRINATTKLEQVAGNTKWNPLRVSVDKDESFKIWSDLTDRAKNTLKNLNDGAGNKNNDDEAPDVEDEDSIEWADNNSPEPPMATFDDDGTLIIEPAAVAAATEMSKVKDDKGVTTRRLAQSRPFKYNGATIEKKDMPWYTARKQIGALYEDGAGKTRETLIHTLGLWETTPLTYLRLSASRYNRFKLPTPDSVLQKSFAHVFFVRPRCNIKMSASQNKLDEKSDDNSAFANNPNFMYAASNSPQIIQELSYDCINQSSDFSFILSNAAVSFSLNDEYINTDTYGTGYTGYKVSYGKHGVESRTAGEFNVTFQDDRNMDVYHMIKLWASYIDGCYTGTFRPKSSTILNHELDYTGAVYYILTAEDGETILFWSKYYGVYPSTIPSNQYSWSAGTLLSHISLDVKFNYSWKEDYDIAAIAEFNYNSRLENAIKSSGGENTVDMVPTYNEALGTAGRTWVGPPFIETIYENGGEPGSYGNGNMKFKLRFRSS